MPRQEKERILKELAQAPKFEEYSAVAWKFSKALIKNKRLAHLDFSFNGFKAKDVNVIGNSY